MADSGYGTNTLGTRVAYVSYETKRDGQQIENSLMEEITERINVTLEDDPSSDQVVIRSQTEPSDTSAIWQPIDANGINVGPVYTYNPDTASWEPSGLTDDDIPNSPPPIQTGVLEWHVAGQKTVSLINAFSLLPSSDKIAATITGYEAAVTTYVWVVSVSLTEVVFESSDPTKQMYIIAGQVES